MRLATQHDVEAILPRLQWMLDNSPAPQMRIADLISAELGVRDAIHRARGWIVHGYFIMAEVARCWYSQRTLLIEDLILRVYPNHNTPVEKAIAALDDIAAQVGATHIIVGDTQIGYMAEKYKARGFVPLGSQLLKEAVPYGIRPQADGR